jgi:hypothetical protein
MDPPQQLLYCVLLLPRTDRWISCQVQIWWSAKQDYQTIPRDGLHLQVGPDNSHGRSAQYSDHINKPGFHGRLFFSLGGYWSFGSSSRGKFWPISFGRRLLLGSTRRLLCHLRHGFFYSGGWSLSRSAHRVPVVLYPLIYGVGRWNLV